MEPMAVLSWQEYEQLLADQLKLSKIQERFRELEASKLHNRDNLFRFFREVL